MLNPWLGTRDPEPGHGPDADCGESQKWGWKKAREKEGMAFIAELKYQQG